MRRNCRRCLTISLIGLICYINTIFGTFVFDDSEAILKNKDVLPTTPISNLFYNDFWGTNISMKMSHKSYRPLTILTYRLNVLLSGYKLHPMHMHLTNVILYVILCILMFQTYKIFLDYKKKKNVIDVSYFASLLFTVHPVHTEVVAGLVGRADILSSILFLISLLLYRRYLLNGRRIFYMLVIFFTLIAVLCKETAITVLGLCVVYDCIHSNVFENKSLVKIIKYSRPFILRTIGLGIAGLIIIFLRLYVMDFEGPVFTKIDNPAAYSEDLLSRILTYNYLYFLNILILIWPQWLCFDWSMGCIPLIENICDIRVVFVIILWIICTISGYYFVGSFLKNNISKPVFFAISMLVIPFLPACNLFLKVGFVIAERILLLPSAGYCLLVVLGYQKFKYYFKNKKAYCHLFYVFCGILSVRTIQRNFEWLSEENLFTSALHVCPLNAKVHYNVAKVASDKNNNELALSEYRRAIELNPNYEQAMNNLANMLKDEKKFEEAELLLRKALEVRPNFAAAWMNLAIVLSNLNKPEEAEQSYLTAISHRNKYPGCYYNLGNLYLEQKRYDEALAAWGKAVQYQPTLVSAWSNTLVLLDSLNRYDEVLKHAKIALMNNPKSAALHFSIANTLGKIHDFEQAEMHFLESINLSPKSALYYSNLGVLYHRWGRTEQARDMYRKALHIDPNMKSAEANLRRLLHSR